MAFPQGWPPRVASGTASIRFYKTGSSTADFADAAFLFIDGTGANPYTPLPVVLPGDDVSRYPTPAATVIAANPLGTGENDPGSVKAMIWSQGIRVRNLDGTNSIEISFDGTNVHGIVAPNATNEYVNRREAGIAVRGAAGTPSYVIEAW